MPVLLLVLDGLPLRSVSPATTPTLHRLLTDGAAAVDGGRAVMTTTTAPNLASFATGTTPGRHGITTGRLPGPGGSVVDAAERGPKTPTLFDALRAAGRSCGVAVADRRVVGLLGASAADVIHAAAPSAGEPVVDAERADIASVEAIVGLLDDPPDVVFGHLRLPDAAAHRFGPDDGDAHGAYRATDRRLAIVLDAAARQWDDVLLVVVSDHDQEPVVPGLEPVDLERHVATRSLPLQVVAEGGAALVLGPDRRAGQWLAEVPGVAGSLELSEEVRLVWARPGRVLGPG